MNKHLLKYIAFCGIAMLWSSCNEGESKLLEPKVYFENKEQVIEVTGDEPTMGCELQARVSALSSSAVEVSYAMADASVVEAYNEKNGTNYELFDLSKAAFKKSSATIGGEEVYSQKTVLELSNLNEVKEGSPYLLPVRIQSASLPVIQGSDVFYLIIKKPVRITKACLFRSNYVKVPLLTDKPFKSVTYEALVSFDMLRDNNTIMGCEGKLILRVGDLALPNHHNDWLEIAGEKNYHSTQVIGTKRWYHLAFTYDQVSGKTVLYINGEKAAESKWDTPQFDLSSAAGGFFIGKVAGFMWGERPLYGFMSEARLWSVARTENQIQQNMLSVDPKSEGLEAYYKLNGEDQFQKDGKWYIKDASGHDMDGLANGGSSQLNFVDLGTPIVVK